MSHLATVEAQIKDLDAVETACQELGWTFHRGKTTHEMWYEAQKCDHAISIPGERMELGLIAQGDGTFRVNYDDLTAASIGSDRKYLSKENGLCGFLPKYEAEVAKKFFRRKGIRFTEKREGNKVILQGVM